MEQEPKSEQAWTWTCRACAIVGFVVLLVTVGFQGAPIGAYALLIGLFFGPEAARGQIQINRRKDE